MKNTPVLTDNGFRHEYKHEISPHDRLILSAQLRTAARPDPHGDAGGCYTVKSLYFDNADDSVLREKLNGVEPRIKFRIRYYGDDLSFIRLEKKSKIHGLCRKETAPLTVEDCESILHGEYGFLLLRDDPILAEFYVALTVRILRPRNIIQYDREAYTYEAGDVRITIDSGIRASYDPQTFLNPGPCPLSHCGTTLLEIKYDRFIPAFLVDAAHLSGRETTAFSKYAACRYYE